MQDGETAAPGGMDPVELAIMANRVQAIVREMTNTVVRTARSSVIGMARDFSCAIVTAENELLGAAESLPIHIFGLNLQSAAMQRLHPDFREGDAYLHNDPYLGNSHPADHAILVPVFVDGAHVFTAAVKAHQADCGNSVPTTYFAGARDVYEEGSLTFPAVLVQRDYRDNEDIVRMCRRRIRVPDQWYGDYLAAVGACRIAERHLKAFVAQHGPDKVQAFVRAWFDYSERRTRHAISRLPKGRLVRTGHIDALPPVLPDPVPLKVAVEIDPERGRIEVDLRDNPDCLDAGVNQTEATATATVLNGIYNCLDWDIPQNSGSFRCIDVLLRENCVAGIPEFPHSCSTATTLVADALVNLTHAAFSELGEGFGLSEGNVCNSVGASVISGRDPRRDDAPYVNQIFPMGGGGPASPRSDGMTYYLLPPAAGLLYRDSVELDEQRYPLLVRSMRMLAGSAGAGRHRGGPATEVVFGPRLAEMTVITMSNGQDNPPRGVLGGADGSRGGNEKIDADGTATVLPAYVDIVLRPGEWVRGIDNGGGGYGDPLQRRPDLVLEDVREGLETAERARAIYGVVVTASATGDWQLDGVATAAARAAAADAGGAAGGK